MSNDIGFLNHVPLDGTILVPVICRNGSETPSTPDAAPTYTVLEGVDGAMTQVGSQTGSMTLTAGSLAGLRGVILTVSAANGYASGNAYTVHIAYTISAASYSAIATFQVT